MSRKINDCYEYKEAPMRQAMAYSSFGWLIGKRSQHYSRKYNREVVTLRRDFLIGANPTIRECEKEYLQLERGRIPAKYKSHAFLGVIGKLLVVFLTAALLLFGLAEAAVGVYDGLKNEIKVRALYNAAVDNGVISDKETVSVDKVGKDYVEFVKKNPTLDSFSELCEFVSSSGNVDYVCNNIKTYLIAGLDKYENDPMAYNYGGRNNNQADFIVLLVVNKSTRKIDFINLNRDTYTTVDVPADKYSTGRKVTEQLCLAHTYGDGKKESGENLRNAVNHLLYDKVNVDHFLTMKMDAVKAITDFLGGVTVTLYNDEDLTSVDPSWTAGATLSLSGDNALKFIRYRDTSVEGSNAGRIDRQSRFLKALLKTVGDKKWSSKYLLDAYEAVGEYTESDYTNVDDLLADLQTMFEAFGMYEYGDVVNIVPDKYGRYETIDTYGEDADAFILDEAVFKELVVETFFGSVDNHKKTSMEIFESTRPILASAEIDTVTYGEDLLDSYKNWLYKFGKADFEHEESFAAVDPTVNVGKDDYVASTDQIDSLLDTLRETLAFLNFDYLFNGMPLWINSGSVFGGAALVLFIIAVIIESAVGKVKKKRKRQRCAELMIECSKTASSALFDMKAEHRELRTRKDAQIYDLQTMFTKVMDSRDDDD